MISQNSIDKVRDNVNLIDVVSRFVKLKPAGRTYIGACPFHNEKTASFSVNPDFYKCFGCGASGDAIKFLQEHERLSFAEAIEYLAEDMNIAIDYDKHYTPLELETIKARKKDIEICLDIAHRFYHKQLMNAPEDAPIWKYLLGRKMTKETAIDWQLGWAPAAWDNITTTLINRGFQKLGIDLGLLSEKNGKTYDKYRDRLIMPSHSKNHQLNGFVGRILSDTTEAKYINPCDSEIYNKSNELFGLNRAIESIKTEGFAILVEGNIDVITLHQHEVKNSVCPGGTALTIEQLKILKRYTDTICIMTDGDSAGQKAALKWIDLILALDFKVNIIELPWGSDPDSYVKSLIEST